MHLRMFDAMQRPAFGLSAACSPLCLSLGDSCDACGTSEQLRTGYRIYLSSVSLLEQTALGSIAGATLQNSIHTT